MICQYCARANPEEAVFCAGCGRPLPVAGFSAAADHVRSTEPAPFSAFVTPSTGVPEEPAELAAVSDETPPLAVPAPEEPSSAVVAPATASPSPVVLAPAQPTAPRQPIKPAVWIAAAVVLVVVLAVGVPPVFRVVRFRMDASALAKADRLSQAAAARSLAASKDSRALPLLAQAMSDDDFQVRKAAQEGLLSFGPAAFDPCMSLLGEGDPAARHGAIEVARRLADGRAIGPLCALLEDDSNDAATRTSIIQAVAALGVAAGDSSPVPHLTSAISDEDEDVRVAAIEGLAGFRDASAVAPLVTAFTTGGQRTSDAAAQALETIGSPSVYPLMCSTADPGMSSRALALVRRIGPDAADEVVRAIGHSNARVRTAAIGTIVEYNYSEASAMEALIARLRNDRVVAVRIAAANALGGFKADAASDPLFTILCKNGNKALRASAAAALVRIWGTGDRALLYALRDRNTKAVAKLYKRFIRWGEPETLKIMCDAVLKHGTRTMALAYLNSGNSRLNKAARRWGRNHGYRVVRRSGRGWSGPQWGGF